MNNQTRRGKTFFHAIEALECRRLLSAGDLDLSFGGDGRASIAFAGSALTIADAVVQADGKVVVVGQKGSLAVAVRLNTDGSIDTGFGVGGLVEFTGLNNASAVAFQTDGRIVVVGARNGVNMNFAAARLMGNGTPDPSFGGDGYVEAPFNDFSGGYSGATEVALQRDGKIVAVGYANIGIVNPDEDMVVIRFNADGQRDPSFNQGVAKVYDFGDYDRGQGVTIDYNGSASSNPQYGKILVVSTHAAMNSPSKSFVVTRLNTNGSSDNTFEGDGSTATTFSGLGVAVGRGIVAQPGGKVVVAGGVAASASPSARDFMLVRYNANGSKDTSFGPLGTGQIRYSLGNNDQPNEIVTGYDGHLLVGGSTDGHAGVVAFTSSGRLETNFQNGGKLISAFTSGTSLAIAPNQKFILAGATGVSRHQDFIPTVQLTSFGATAVESPLDPANLVFYRSVALPVPTRVFFTISGTAAVGADYSGVTLFDPVIGGTTRSKSFPQPIRIGVIEIPAGQFTVIATITPVNDGVAEPIEKAIFTVIDGSDYAIGVAKAVTVTISDTAVPATTVTLSAAADAYVQDGSTSDTNFGSTITLQSKATAMIGFSRQSYLKFDLSSVGVVHSAKIHLFGRLNNPDETNIAAGIFSVADTSWTETGITWNNKPAGGTTALATVSIIDQTNRWYEWDLTSYLAAEKAAGRNIVSLMIRNPTNSSPAAVFSSDEAIANHPELVVS